MTILPTHAFAAALEADFAAPIKTRAKPIPREAWRQEKAVVWVRGAVIEPHLFLAYDRTQARGDQSHLFQWRRGLRADTLDTELLTATRSFRFEFKAVGQKVDDDDGQAVMIKVLRSLNVAADWGCTIADLCGFYRREGVKLANNAEYQALYYDGMVDSRIARAEAERNAGAPAKKTRSYKPGPRLTVGKRLQRRAAAKGVRI